MLITSGLDFSFQATLPELIHTDQEPNIFSSSFLPYQSPLTWYPLLRSHSRHCSSDRDTTSRTAAFEANSLLSTPVDLEPLKATVTNQWLSDPSRRVCQYEVPGGGECRDKDCEDIHLSRMESVEPTGTCSHYFVTVAYLFIFLTPHFPRAFLSDYPFCLFSADDETAQYLCSFIPSGSSISVNDIKIALENARSRAVGPSNLDSRVAEALASLNLR